MKFQGSVLPALLAAALLPFTACDSGKEEDKKADDKSGKKADDKGGDKADAKAKPDAKEEAPKEPEKKILACDQRDFVPEGAKKMAEQMGKEAEPKRVCMDYTKRESPGKPSCVQGTPLETGCPDEGVVATCTMKNGVVYKHYEGASVGLSEKSCGTLEGTFAKM